jgi:hypothetical protein
MITAYKDRYLHIHERAGKKPNIVEKRWTRGKYTWSWREEKKNKKKDFDIYLVFAIYKDIDEVGRKNLQRNKP